jgi:hypothetical protein
MTAFPNKFILAIMLAITLLCCVGCSNDRLLVQDVSLAGKVVSSDRTEWLNDRLVVLFLKGREVGRTTSALQKAPPEILYGWSDDTHGTSNSNEDGIFFITGGSNPYALTTYMLSIDTGRKFSFAHLRGKSDLVAYTWLGELVEGASVVFPIKSKNTRYVLRVIEGDISSLPKEILRPGSLQLKEDNTIIVSSGISTTADLQGLANSVGIEALHSDPQSEIEINKLTIPIDNCGGTVSVRQKYSQTQSFIKQINTEVSAKIGVEIPLAVWFRMIAELQAKYGFEQGEVDSRTIEYEMGAEPRSKVVYVVTWKEVWDSGTAKVISSQKGFSVPFRVRTNLIFQIDSKKIACP